MQAEMLQLSKYRMCGFQEYSGQHGATGAETSLKVRRISLIGSPSFVIYLHYFSACYGRLFLFIYQIIYVAN